MGISIKLPDLYPKQRAVFFDPARIVVCEASTKAGKTMGSMTWQLSEANGPAASHLWVAPVYHQAEMAFDRLCRMFARGDPGATTGWHYNKTKLVFSLPTGHRIVYRGGDNPDSIYGADYATAVIDEATRCKPEVWHAVMTTTTATNGRIRIIGNVKGRHNWAYNLARKAQSGAPGMAYFKLIAADAIEAGVLSDEAVQAAKEVLPEQVFRELYLAEPSDDGGNPFGLGHIGACVMDGDAGDPCAYGVDLAKSVDWTVVIGLDAEGRTAQFHRWQRVPWSETQRRIVEIIGDTPTLIDSTGVGDPVVEAIQYEAPNVTGYQFTLTSKQKLMEGLAVAIQKRQVSYPDGPIRQELETFEYETTRTGVRYTAPEGLHDDCVCALALAVECRRTAIEYGIVGVTMQGDRAETTKAERDAHDVRVRTERMTKFLMGSDL